tara:strand:+ start:6073 stop:6195 length:123 start_codon:yes stop_codon:yes gene_type:complete
VNDSEEIICFYCDTCEEEYQLPESAETCPFCEVSGLEAMQ